MVKYVCVAVIAALCLQVALAKPKKAAQAPVEKSQLEELSAVAQKVVNNITTTLGINDLDTKKVADILNNQTQTLAANVQDIAKKLQGEISAHKGDIDNVIKQVSEKLTETANSLQSAAGPDAQAKAKELREKFDTGIKSAYAEIEKLVKAVEPDVKKAQESISSVAKSALDQIVEVGQNLQQQVKQTLDEHENGHKKQ